MPPKRFTILATEAGSSSDNAIREVDGILPLINLIAQRPTAMSAHAAVLVLRELTSIDTPACERNRIAISNAGGIEVLVQRLNDHSNRDPARLGGVAGALWNLAAWHPLNSTAIGAADGAISGLSRVVREAVQNQPAATKVARLSAAAEAVAALSVLASPQDDIPMTENQNTIRESQCIPFMVELLRSSDDRAVHFATYALGSLAIRNADNQQVIEKTGAVPLLFEGLTKHHREERETFVIEKARQAARALAHLMETATCAGAIFSYLIESPTAVDLTRAPCEALRVSVHSLALTKIDEAMQGESITELNSAMSVAKAVHVAAERLAPAMAKAAEMEEKAKQAVVAERQRRHEELGIAGIPDRYDMICPITTERMMDPVVASDGHSYEREAITSVLQFHKQEGTQALSPLTRENLTDVLIPNINLRKRIRAYDAENNRRERYRRH